MPTRIPLRPVGAMTRGTTNPNRLRRVDRFLTGPLAHVLRNAGAAPVVVDLGFGASARTPLELHERLRRVRADIRLVGVEIDPERVATARRDEAEDRRFLLGGFEVPVPADWPRPTLIRALNVLRQYPEHAVAGAWELMCSRLAPGGVLVEGTCDEIGRRSSWVTLDAAGPQALTLSVRLDGLDNPRDIAERLPKALIHRNVPGERIHAWLQTIERQWAVAAPYSSFGPRQRWIATVQALKDLGWPVWHGVERWRLGEVTVAWASVAPSSGRLAG